MSGTGNRRAEGAGGAGAPTKRDASLTAARRHAARHEPDLHVASDVPRDHVGVPGQGADFRPKNAKWMPPRIPIAVAVVSPLENDCHRGREEARRFLTAIYHFDSRD